RAGAGSDRTGPTGRRRGSGGEGGGEPGPPRGPKAVEAGPPAAAGTAGGGQDGDVVTPEGSAPRAARTYNDPPQTGASSEPSRAILRQPGLGSWLAQPGPRLRPPLQRPRLPSPRPAAAPGVGDHHQHPVDPSRPPPPPPPPP